MNTNIYCSSFIPYALFLLANKKKHLPQMFSERVWKKIDKKVVVAVHTITTQYYNRWKKTTKAKKIIVCICVNDLHRSQVSYVHWKNNILHYNATLFQKHFLESQNMTVTLNTLFLTNKEK